MTKETKIGLLVGLAFIILFGIILSEKGTTREEFGTASMSAYKPVVELVPPKATSYPQLARSNNKNIADKLIVASSNKKKKFISDRHIGQSEYQNKGAAVTPSKKTEINKNSLSPKIQKLLTNQKKNVIVKKIPASAPTAVSLASNINEKDAENSYRSFNKELVESRGEGKLTEKLAKDASERSPHIIAVHKVSPGENLINICKKYYPGRAYKMVKIVMRFNNISRPERLLAGQELKLPADDSNNIDSANLTVAIKSSENASSKSENAKLVTALLKPVNNSQISAIANLKPVKVPIIKSVPATKELKIYVVQQNDSLCKIARKFYGTERLWIKIYNSNRDVLDDPNKIRSGIKLKIPFGEELAKAE